jgi:hypothetical protein
MGLCAFDFAAQEAQTKKKNLILDRLIRNGRKTELVWTQRRDPTDYENTA